MEKISIIRFDNVFEKKMENIKTRFSQTEASSKYAPSGTSTGLSKSVWTALRLWTGNAAGEYFVAAKKNGAVVEKKNDDGTTQVVETKRTNTNGPISVNAGHVSGDVQAPYIDAKPYIIRTKTVSGYNGTAILCAMMPFILAEEEAQEIYKSLLPYLIYDENSTIWDTKISSGETNLEAFAKLLAIFGDNIYRRIQQNEKLPVGIGLVVPEEQRQIKNLSLLLLKQKCTKIAGNPIYFTNVIGTSNSSKTGSVNKIFTPEEIESYRLDGTYTDEQKSYIPDMGDKFSWSEWIINTVRYIKLSNKYMEPLRTMYLVGPSGTGKSKGSAAMAQLLNIPYFYLTCSPDMELFDLFGQIFPNTNPGQKLDFEAVRKEMGLPSVEDIMMDVKSSYVRIFKKSYDGTSEADIICEMINLVNKEVAERCNTKDYTYVEGAFVKAIRYGYLFEIQEIGIVKRPGVAVALNSILEAGKNVYCTLPTGEIIYRHPNTVLCFTSNDEYEGTANLNQSVLSRLGHCYYFKNAIEDEMVARTKAIVFDFDSDSELKKMAGIISEISSYCRENDITDGVCGQRELNNWAMECMLEKEIQGESILTPEIIRKACQTTVLNKVSQNRDDIADVAYAIVNPKYGECDMTI